jgi:serine/threonine-protein kinase
VSDPPDPRRIRPITDALADVVVRCMARDRWARYADARATLAAWDAAAGRALTPPRAPDARASRAPGTREASDACVSVAVLPIQNLGGAEDGFLAEGVTDDLIDALSMTPKLRVRPRGMVARFAARDVDPREAGRALDVEVVVEASLRRTPTGVRLSARLLGVADGFQLWAQRFDCSIGELLVASDEAARAVAKALASHLDAPARKAPTDGSAVEVYLRARDSLRRNWYGASREPLALFTEALWRAPDDPLILAGLAMARSRFARTPTEVSEARAVAERAIAAGPRLGQPWIAMATLHRHEGETLRQIAALARALEVAPRQAEAHAQIGRLLLEVGPLGQALPRLELAASVDPADDEARAHLAWARFVAGDAAAAEAKLAMKAEGGSAPLVILALVRARMQLWLGAPASSVEADRAAGTYIELVHEALAESRLSPAAESAFTQSERPVTLKEQLLAEVCLAIRDVDAAVTHATKAVDAGLMDLVWFDGCPLIDAARAHPAWPALRARTAERADAAREAIAREGLMAPSVDDVLQSGAGRPLVASP